MPINQTYTLKRKVIELNDQLFFMHIPKTAGTTFVNILEQLYTVDDICPPYEGLSQLIKNYTPQQLTNFKLIRGHFPYELLKHLNSEPRLVTFLRHPIQRTISAFNHLKRWDIPQEKSFYDNARDFAKQTQNISLDELMKETELANHIRNKTQKFLVGKLGRANANLPLDLEQAKERLAGFEFIGVTEHFDESLALFLYTFNLPEMISYKTYNVAPNKSSKTEISQNVLDYLAEINQDEIELYEYGLSIFKNRLAQMREEKKNEVKVFELHSHKKQRNVQFDFSHVYPGQGWYVGEPHPQYSLVRWSGPTPTSRLFFSLDSQYDYRIRFRVIATLATEILQSLTLSVNDSIISLTHKPDGEDGQVIFEGTINNDILDEQQMMTTFTFEVNKTISPSEIDDQNDDPRLLGLCYQWLHIYVV